MSATVYVYTVSGVEPQSQHIELAFGSQAIKRHLLQNLLKASIDILSKLRNLKILIFAFN